MSEREYESSCKVWSGKDILGIFHTLGITAATFSILKVCQIDLLSCLLFSIYGFWDTANAWLEFVRLVWDDLNTPTSETDFLPQIPYILQHTLVSKSVNCKYSQTQHMQLDLDLSYSSVMV